MKVTRTKIDSSKVVVKNPLIQGGGGIEPEGNLVITENGSYNINQYASVYVNIPVINHKKIDNIGMNSDLSNTAWLILEDAPESWGDWTSGSQNVLCTFDEMDTYGYYYDSELTKTDIVKDAWDLTQFTDGTPGPIYVIANIQNIFKKGNIVTFKEIFILMNVVYDMSGYTYNNEIDLAFWLIENAVLLGCSY